MTHFYLVRHGQTDWNKEGRYQGQANTPLNVTGQEQARRIAAKLAHRRVDAIYSSDLDRARCTAEAVAEQLELPVRLDRRLREINHGEWEGMLFTDIVRQYGREIQERETNPLQARAPGGESVTELAQRVLAAADDIAQSHPGETVVLVSHGLSLAVLVCAGHGYPFTEVFQHVPDNAHPDLIEWTVIPNREIG
jgi:alpha-ribazole phosphatase